MGFEPDKVISFGSIVPPSHAAGTGVMARYLPNLGIRNAASGVSMAQGKQDNDVMAPTAATTGVGGFAFVIVPGFEQAASIIGWICLILVGLAVLGVALLGIFRLATPERNMRGMTRNTPAPALRPPEPEPAKVESHPEPKLEPVPAPALTSDPIITATELVGQFRSIDGFQFEKLIELVYRKLGYDVTRRIGANPDSGIDLIIQKDGEYAAVQYRQWKARRAGVQQVREFLGALTEADLPHGKFITLCGYTNPAMQFAKRHGIEIVTEAELADMLETADTQSDQAILDLLPDTRKFCPKGEAAVPA